MISFSSKARLRTFFLLKFSGWLADAGDGVGKFENGETHPYCYLSSNPQVVLI